MSIEKPYKPSPEEMKKAEEAMTEKQKEGSKERGVFYEVAEKEEEKYLSDNRLKSDERALHDAEEINKKNKEELRQKEGFWKALFMKSEKISYMDRLAEFAKKDALEIVSKSDNELVNIFTKQKMEKIFIENNIDIDKLRDENFIQIEMIEKADPTISEGQRRGRGWARCYKMKMGGNVIESYKYYFPNNSVTDFQLGVIINGEDITKTASDVGRGRYDKDNNSWDQIHIAKNWTDLMRDVAEIRLDALEQAKTMKQKAQHEIDMEDKRKEWRRYYSVGQQEDAKKFRDKEDHDKSILPENLSK